MFCFVSPLLDTHRFKKIAIRSALCEIQGSVKSGATYLYRRMRITVYHSGRKCKDRFGFILMSKGSLYLSPRWYSTKKNIHWSTSDGSGCFVSSTHTHNFAPCSCSRHPDPTPTEIESRPQQIEYRSQPAASTFVEHSR